MLFNEDVVDKESGPVDEAVLVGASAITATLLVWGRKAIIPLLISLANDLNRRASASEVPTR